MKKEIRMHAGSVLRSIKKHKRISVYIALLFLFSFLNLVVGCTYYRIVPLDRNKMASAINSENKKGYPQYIVLHYGDEMWYLSDATFDENSKEMSGVLQVVDEQHKLFPPVKEGGGRRYDPKISDKALEVHVYINKYVGDELAKKLAISYTDISKVEVYDHDAGRTILAFVGITFGVILVVAIIVAATKSSCPFVYVNDGEKYEFNGEIYPGAILPNLERTDYLKLNNLKPHNGSYSLKIVNKLKEIQYTDLSELIVVNHSENTLVLMDQKGEVYTLQNENRPLNAYRNDIKINPKSFFKTDQDFYTFDDEELNDKPNSIVLEFENNKKTNSAKLHLNLKNSFWMDYMYGKFNEQFGSYYNTFQKKQRKLSRESCVKWSSDQYIPLSVYIKQGDNWKWIENINTVGPLSTRDLVVPINDIPANEKIQIKLESGFLFWDIDYAGMDFSGNDSVKYTTLKPFEAIDETGKNVTSLLMEKDGQYLVQPKIGNEVTLNFNVIPSEIGTKQSYFFKTIGYYEYIRDYKGVPNFIKLQTFRNKGALNKFSFELYKEFISDSKNLNLTSLRNE